MLILGTLFVMFILIVFSIMLGSDLISDTDSVLIDSEALINGTSSTFVSDTGSIAFSLGINELTGVIILLTTITVIASVVGIQFLGSGLSDTSVRTIMIVSVYSGLWIILSVLVYNLIILIEVLGSLLYILLTICYTIGVIQKITSD